jgi:hypothetical protein
VSGKIKICFNFVKKGLTRIGAVRYTIKHIYKTTPAFSWNIPIFGGFFPPAKSFHPREAASLKTRGKGGDHGEATDIRQFGRVAGGSSQGSRRQ